MDALVILIPLLPLLAAVMIGGGQLMGWLRGASGNTLAADIATGSIYLACMMSLTLLGADLMGKNHGFFSVGQWLGSDSLNIRLNFICTGFNVHLATLFAVLFAIVGRFSANNRDKEAESNRYFTLLSLFTSAMLLMVLSANQVLTLIGWICTSVCAYFLIGYSGQPIKTANATRVLISHRIGDIGFIIGISLSYAWLDSVNWYNLKMAAEQLTIGEATGISLCFTLAAAAKSAQLPFTPWLVRAMDGQMPVTATLCGAMLAHAGVFLVLLSEPVFSQSPFALAVLGLVGFATTIYSYIVAKTQTDRHSTLAFAISGQLGLMFLTCSLGFWDLATWYLYVHIVIRCYQCLTIASEQRHVEKSSNQRLSRPDSTGIYILSLQHFWLEQLTDWALVNPIRGLAHDLSYFDDHVVDRIMGVPAPAIGTLTSLAQAEEVLIGTELDRKIEGFSRSNGLVGKLAECSAALMHWFESRIVLNGIGKHRWHQRRQFGHAINKFEQMILRPRYLVLFVCFTFLIAF